MIHNFVRLIVPALLGALILLFPAQGLRALGLGEARVDSWLGQTLDVSIRLLDIESAAIESISVGPASLSDHERLGLPSESLALGLEVTVDRRVDPPRVRVRSQQPANDPVVQILIDARWASGRVLREYTLFLDPPTVASAAPAPLRRTSETASAPPSPVESAEVTERVAESTPQRPLAAAPRQPAAAESEPEPEPRIEPETASSLQPSSSALPTDAVQVSRGDTLWSIAQAWRPEQGLSMDQVMLAIFNRNRKAFLEGNINRMRSDVRLEMPGLDEVRALDRAAAELRIREHMRAWQPAADRAVPVVSDAAIPEQSVADPVQQATVSTAVEAERSTAPAAGPDEQQVVHRLDVVPPEDELFSDGTAVAEEEINQVSDSLAELEREIAEQDFDNAAFDEHVQEVRSALAQRDIAGLAVARESLAELQERLREARLARAELEDAIAPADAGDVDDAVADYMRQLGDEFGVADSGDDTALTGAAESEGRVDDTGLDTDQAAAEAIDESGLTEAATGTAPRPMTHTLSNGGGLSTWLWPLIGLLVLVIAVFWALRWLSGRSARQSAAELAGGDALDAARSAIVRDPEDLGARLALLKLLADQGDEQGFTDAFDQMYQEVDDETAPQWQDALSLAAIQIPDHPLLQPNETAYGGHEDYDRRADEMLSMLEVDEEQDEPDSSEASADEQAGADFDTDTDLAVLARRLDEPADERIENIEAADDEDTADTRFDEYQEGEELDSGLAIYQEESADAEDAEDAEDDGDGDDTDAADEFGLAFESPPPGSEDHVDDGEDAGGDEEGDEEGDIFASTEPGFSEAPEAGLPSLESEDVELDFSSELSDEGQDSISDEADFLSGELDDPVDEPLPADFDSTAAQVSPALNDEDADVKLDLARAYISVGLADSARPVLEEVLSGGSQAKRSEAQQLLDEMV